MISEHRLQISLCEARDRPFSSGIQDRGLECCWQQLLTRPLCSCGIILQPVNFHEYLCPQFPGRHILLASGSQGFLSAVVFVCYMSCKYPWASYLVGGDSVQLPYKHQRNSWTPCAAIAPHLEGTEACSYIFWWITPTQRVSGSILDTGKVERVIFYLWKLSANWKHFASFVIPDSGQILLVCLEQPIWSCWQYLTVSSKQDLWLSCRERRAGRKQWNNWHATKILQMIIPAELFPK